MLTPQSDPVLGIQRVSLRGIRLAFVSIRGRGQNTFGMICLICGCWAILALATATSQASDSSLPDVYSQDVARFERLVTSYVAELRIEGIQGLSHLKHWPAEEALIGRLRDPSEAVRCAAVDALCRLGTTRSVPHLIRLMDHPQWHTKRRVHLALQRMTARDLGDQRQAWQAWWDTGTSESRQSELLAALTTDANDPDSQPTRTAALRALVHLADASAESAIVRLLDTPPQPRLSEDERRYTIEVLERIGSPRAVPVLVRQRRDAAAWALGRIGGEQAEQGLLTFPLTLPVLMNLDRLHSEKCGPFVPRLVPRMGLVTYRSQPDDLHAPPTPFQRVAANLIRRSGAGPELIEAILAELEATADPDNPRPAPEPPEHLRELMVRFREELGPGFVRNDGVTTSQPLTALSLVADDPALADRLIPLLHHPAFVVRIYVAMTLANLNAMEALPEIVGIIRESYDFSDAATLVSGKHFDQSQTVRWRGFLCMALGRMGSPQARLILEELAADPNQFRDIRFGAVVGLGEIGSPESLPVLNQIAQQDLLWMVRDTARLAIEDIQIKIRAEPL